MLTAASESAKYCCQHVCVFVPVSSFEYVNTRMYKRFLAFARFFCILKKNATYTERGFRDQASKNVIVSCTFFVF